MFLIRTAFWLSLVIMFLPAGNNDGDSEVNSVSAFEAYFAAQATFGDLSKFCERNTSTCETGSAIISTFGQKARYGARMVFEYLDIKFGESEQATVEKTTGADNS